MQYTLDQFIADARGALQAENNAAGREKVRQLVERLLQNQAFVASAFPEDAEAGRQTIYEEPNQGFIVLAHVAGKAGKSPPHDHGPSWAVYGQVTGYTDMTVWHRTDGGTGGGDASLEKVKEYRLNPGEVGKYDVGDIHSIAFPDGARFLRVTGRDLDYVERLKFDAAAGKAIVIESASAQ
jgi:predicted metal-dependent enzyme (double-stranded beta helix superfamily)